VCVYVHLWVTCLTPFDNLEMLCGFHKKAKLIPLREPMWIDASFLLFVWIEMLWEFTTSCMLTHTLGFSKEDMRKQLIQISEPTDGQDTNG